jgi:hypothetical protein
MPKTCYEAISFSIASIMPNILSNIKLLLSCPVLLLYSNEFQSSTIIIIQNITYGL